MTCPLCGRDGDATDPIGGITICGACGRSLVLDGEDYRAARAEDTVRLSTDTIKALKKLRPKRG